MQISLILNKIVNLLKKCLHFEFKHPRCGLPPFAENLPDDIKEKLEKIWENYEVGTDCKEQRDATQQIVREKSLISEKN